MSYDRFPDFRFNKDLNRWLVENAERDGIDAAFAYLAKQARKNSVAHPNGKSNGMTFLKPTNVSAGYFNVLKTIVLNPCLSRGEIAQLVTGRKCTLLGTFDRLFNAEMIKLQDDLRAWKAKVVVATDFGKAYYAAAEKYVINVAQPVDPAHVEVIIR